MRRDCEHGEGTHDSWEQAKAKERADACRKTDDHRQQAEPRCLLALGFPFCVAQ